MSPAAPRVSVALPVRDGEPWVRAAVESVRAQSLRDWELVVADDGSQDGTPAYLDEVARADPRVVVLHRPPRGLGPATREAAAAGRAPLVAKMDADDVAHPERLARQVAFLDAHPEVHVLGTAVRLVDPTGRPVKDVAVPLSDSGIRERLAVESVLFHPTVVLRRAALDAVGGYREAPAPAEDLDLWLRLAETGHRFAALPEPLLDYRVHPGQASHDEGGRAARAALAVRLSARARAEGRPDLLEGAPVLTDPLLAALGATPAALARARVDQLAYAARKMEQIGARRAAASRWRLALRLAAGLPDERRAALAGVLAARARARAEEGRRVVARLDRLAARALG